MGMSREERKIYHGKQTKDSGGQGVPQASQMDEGVGIFRTTARGVVQYVKLNGVVYQSPKFKKGGESVSGDSIFESIDLTASGFVKFPNRLVLQWGTQSSISSVTFDMPYVIACFGVYLGKHTDDNDQIPFVKSVSKTGFSYDTNDSAPTDCYWLAIGK